MALQFCFGTSGAGKSYTLYNQMIEAAMANPKKQYILLVPEQYSMALQRKMVMLHPKKGSMNIDVYGFNRLTYRVFDELNIKPQKVLEDFGKTMLIRQVAGACKEKLSVYGGCLDKSGFIDEIKSLMSEMYQYDLSREALAKVQEELEDTEVNEMLKNKLHDMQLIFDAFDEKIKESYIVAEQLTDLLAENIKDSDYIKDSVIVMDGFTGFTPIQCKIVKELLKYAGEVQMILTMDEKAYITSSGRNLKEHELFYLSDATRKLMLGLAKEAGVTVLPDITMNMEQVDNNKNVICPTRFASGALHHLERNLFRYPYKVYENEVEELFVDVYETPAKELRQIAAKIKGLVRDKKYRYKDIAIISGNLESTKDYVDRFFKLYEVPYFVDYSEPLKNNPYMDALEHIVSIVEENFSYDSVFAFLKSGILADITDDEIEILENYVLKHGIKGVSWWNKPMEGEMEELRLLVMDIILPFYEEIKNGDGTIRCYVNAMKNFMTKFDYEKGLKEAKGVYDKLILVFDKMLEIMPEDETNPHDFLELFKLGVKDISIGRIPNTLDTVLVGDITRTRLEDIKVLFILGMNDGVIPKKSNPAQIITDREKELLSKHEFCLAPTEKTNAYTEQFYLYLNMTKPQDALYLSYTQMDNQNSPMEPSYVIGRVQKLYKNLSINYNRTYDYHVETENSSVETLIVGFREILNQDMSHLNQTLDLYRLYMNEGKTELLSNIQKALTYANIPEKLTKDVAELLKLRLLSQSVSKLEKYAACSYAYFLQYILGLREREIRSIDRRNVGIIMHGSMEKLYRHVHDNMNNAWDKITDEERNRLVDKFVDESYAKEYAGVNIEDEKYQTLRNVLHRIGRRTAEGLSRITNEKCFEPVYFEHHFNDPLLGDKYDVKFNGIVDRCDVFYSPTTKDLQFRIIDYKSSKHEFKIHEVYEGLQLQLTMYLSVMNELVKNDYAKKLGENVKIKPEGMYYYALHDPYVEAANAQKAKEKREKEQKLYGPKTELFDGEFYDNIQKFAHKKTMSIVDDILDGKIDKNPFYKPRMSACSYCVYSSVCRFDTKCGGNQ
ncbi:MAG TPA: hypothetical protein DDY98_04510, partial [Ruminococcaceae bacterium]|nr:hypothetical protein [Oscillospiraceae bacterium]